MGLVLAALVAIATIVWCGMIWFANGMSDAPAAPGIPILPWFVGGMMLAALLAVSHRWGW
jgi:hypothetical protein